MSTVSTASARSYAVAVNPSRFDIVKSQLNNDKRQENQYYLEKMPYTMAPIPPALSSNIRPPLPYSISRIVGDIVDDDDHDGLYAKVNNGHI